MEIMQKQKVYAFIDSQNLNLGTSDGSGHEKWEASHIDTGSKARILPSDKVSIAKKWRKAR